jgi:CHAT domain-containing protein/Tfp pilus assembly protein PilF
MGLIAMAGATVLIGFVWAATPLGVDQVRAGPRTQKTSRADPQEAVRLKKRVVSLYRHARFLEAIEPARRLLAVRIKALGAGHPLVAESQDMLAVLHLRLGAYAKALSLFKRSLAIREKVYGPDHRLVANSLNNIAEYYREKGLYVKAKKLHLRALAIRQKVRPRNYAELTQSQGNLGLIYGEMYSTLLVLPTFKRARQYLKRGDPAKAVPLFQQVLDVMLKNHGPNHRHVAIILNLLARAYYDARAYPKALSLYKRALAVREKIYGPVHSRVGASLISLTVIYTTMGLHAKALPVAKRALAIALKVLGPDHPHVAASLTNLAVTYQKVGDLTRALPLYKRALAIWEKAFGPDHLKVAQGLHNLASLYFLMGDHARARFLNVRALAIREKKLPPYHPRIADTLDHLALVYRVTGDYARALPLFQRALAIRERTLGPDHPAVAKTANNLGGLYEEMGLYTRALPLYKRALAIHEKAFGPDHPSLAPNLNNLAGLYEKLGHPVQALPLYQRALAIVKKAYGPENPYVATILANLGILYANIGEHAQALLHHQRALAIRQKALRPDHPSVAASLNNLAMLYRQMGAEARTVQFYKRALVIWEKALGPGHPNVVACLGNLAGLQAAGGRFEQAWRLMAKAQAGVARLIDQVLGFTSGDQKLRFLAKQQGALSAFISLIAQHLARNDGAVRDAANIWLRRKGVVLKAQRRFQEALVYGGNPKAIETFKRLAAVRAGLARLVFSGPGRKGVEAYRRRLARLEVRKSELEARLSRLSRSYAVGRKAGRATIAKIAQGLPAGSVLVEIARIDFFDFKAESGLSGWRPARYLVFVIRARRPEKVSLVDLGPAGKIEAVIAGLKKAVSGQRPDRQTARRAAHISHRLYRLVFAPLKKHVGGAKTIFISPDGQLSLIPFEILMQPSGRFLIEDYTFNYLAAGRDVLRFGRVKGKTTAPLLLGAPDFNLSPMARRLLLDRLGLASPSRPVPVPARIRKYPLQSLPQTGEEVRAIADLVGRNNCRVYRGPRALKQVLFKARSPRILHLATHGSFLEDVDPPPGLARRGSGGVAPISPVSILALPGAPKKRKRLPHRVFNPLLRSRLFLAGANKDGDGILTAEEVLGLRLWGTELVVLSACQTGLGEVEVGEGVFGLQRAFLQAGARSLVMSLWSVPDLVARQVMVGFYRNFLRRKMDRCQALRRASLARLRLVKKKYGHAHPLLWAGFVFLGER